MKTVNLSSFFVLFFIYNFALASGVSKCYSCSSRDCNDPFNSANAQVMNCSDPNSYRSLEIDNNRDVDRVNSVFQNFNTQVNTNVEHVCIKFFLNSTYGIDSSYTSRRCVASSSNNIGICESTAQMATQLGLGQILNCQTCNTDLCNSATKLNLSLVSTLVFILFGYLCVSNM